MVVQKFGGTSVADPDAIRRLIEIVRTARERDRRGPVVVVSAMSKVTDGLLKIAGDAGDSRTDAALAQVEQLRERHRTVATALVTDAARMPLLAHIDEQFDQLAAVVRALAVLREVSPRTLDVVAAMGELLSSRIVAAALNPAGMPGEWVDARRVIITDDQFMQAAPLLRETCAALRAAVMPILDAGRVPVIGGFVGATLDGTTTTLGRGG